jgi:hypothetical protein
LKMSRVRVRSSVNTRASLAAAVAGGCSRRYHRL